MAKRYKPFATGDEHADWINRNCGTCKKGYSAKRSEYDCTLQFELDFAYCGDGKISEKTARAIGFLNNKDCTIWECPGWARK